MPTKRLLAVLGALLIGGSAASSLASGEEKAKDGKKKSGTVVGEITAKDEKWIEVKADGEEKARRYLPYWRGGLPKAGGAPDKEMLKTIKGLKVGQRVRLEWEFDERPRVVKVEVLKDTEKAPGSDKK